MAEGDPIWQVEVATRPQRGAADACREMADLLRQGQRETGASLVAAGIGCTGPVDPVAGLIGDVELLPGWKGYPLAAEIAAGIGAPVRLENDADAAALAELRFGAGRGSERFLFVSIGTGIGGGIILDGGIYRGHNGAHPEFGHHTIAGEPRCYCGASGCWESLASGPAVARWYNQQREGAEACDAREIFARAGAGEELALRTVERFTQYLAVGLGNLLTLFAPDTIAVGGGVMASAGDCLERAAQAAPLRARLIPTGCRIVPAALANRAGLIGAACVAMEIHE